MKLIDDGEMLVFVNGVEGLLQYKEIHRQAQLDADLKEIPEIKREANQEITDKMFDNGFFCLFYFHPGEGNKHFSDRWV
ncbi:hypothetical protein LCGC14_2387410, partial [marine sediment metagenome]